MVKRFHIDEGTRFQLCRAEIYGGAILETKRFDIAGLIVDEIALCRIGQGIFVAQGTRYFLIDIIIAGVKTRFHHWRNFETDIAVKAETVSLGMIAVAVGCIGADCCPDITRPLAGTKGQQAAIAVEAADIAAEIYAFRSPAGRCHPVDRAAQCTRTKAQGIGSAIDLEMVEEGRFEFLKVAIVIGQIDRNSVLQQGQAAHVEAPAQTGTTDRYPHFLTIARLHIDAGRKCQSIAQRHKRLVGIIIVGDNVRATWCFVGSGLCLVSDARAGDDDGICAAVSLAGGTIGHSRNGKSGKSARQSDARNRYFGHIDKPE